jgi:hypothetical protein
MLSIALSVDLSPPPLHVWLYQLDLDLWQELIDAKAAFLRGQQDVESEANASAEQRALTAQYLKGNEG